MTTYELDELLGTKLRALYQRKKGRDLFDLWIVARRLTIDSEKLARCFLRYVKSDGLRITRAELEANLQGKLDDSVFQRDIEPLLATGTTWDQAAAAEFVMAKVAPLLPGAAWKRTRAG